MDCREVIPRERSRIRLRPGTLRGSVYALIDAMYRAEAQRVFATIVTMVRDRTLAEEALHEAFAAAVAQWPRRGIPRNPRAWLVSAGRFKAIDAIRSRGRHSAALSRIAASVHSDPPDPANTALPDIADDQLRMIFTCCHPDLATDAQVALALRDVCGVTTSRIASGFRASVPAIAQRIVRAKRKIRERTVDGAIPSWDELPERLSAVLRVILTLHRIGARMGNAPRPEPNSFTREAVRLGRLLVELFPRPEVRGVLAVMLLRESEWAHSRSESHETRT